MAMNPQRRYILTHFSPLFIVALGGWLAFHLANSGTAHIVPGIIVASLLAYMGTLFALRTQTVHDLRATYNASITRTAPQFPAIAASTPHGALPLSSRPRPFRADMDIAAGD
jgi:hypothetical protein